MKITYTTNIQKVIEALNQAYNDHPDSVVSALSQNAGGLGTPADQASRFLVRQSTALKNQLALVEAAQEIVRQEQAFWIEQNRLWDEAIATGKFSPGDEKGIIDHIRKTHPTYGMPRGTEKGREEQEQIFGYLWHSHNTQRPLFYADPDGGGLFKAMPGEDTYKKIDR